MPRRSLPSKDGYPLTCALLGAEHPGPLLSPASVRCNHNAVHDQCGDTRTCQGPAFTSSAVDVSKARVPVYAAKI